MLAQVKPQRIRALPIAMPSIENRKPIEDIVNRILYITKDEDYLQNLNKQAKVNALEAEIDQLVYKLYDLTPEEIKSILLKGSTYPQFPPEANPSVLYAWDMNNSEDGDCYHEIMAEIDRNDKSQIP